MTLALRLERLEAAIASAALRAGRQRQDITVLAVSKRQPLSAVLAAYDLGLRDFAENTVQALLERAQAFAAAGRSVRWHMLGRLQRNKAAAVGRLAHCLHSFDRPELLAPLCQVERSLPPLEVLVQINSGEAHKGGVRWSEAAALVAQVRAAGRLSFRGLMLVPPLGSPPRPHFEALRDLLAQLQRPGDMPLQLSMGMSADFEVAIEAGATIVRMGTALFGERPQP